MKKLDNKGFTLVELLAVIVILVIIMGIALPNISSSLERSNDKKDKAMEKVIKSEAELYVSKYKVSIFNKLTAVGSTCYIEVSDLINEGYLSSEDVEDYRSKCLVYDGTEFTVYSTFNGSTCESVSNKCYGD